MKKNANKKYPINQSPFYKLTNHKRLAEILGVELFTLKHIVGRGDNNYYFGHVKGKSERDIEVPKSQLKRVHKKIGKLLARVEANDYLESGVKGRSNVSNAAVHVGNVALAKLDIKKFYPSVTKEIVVIGLKKRFRCSSDIASTIASLCTVDGHIPTGSPVSQVLAYWVNAPVFDHINIYSRSRGITFSLYVDDLTFSGKVIPRYFLNYVSNYLKNTRGFETHKFRTYKAETEKVVTGVVLDQDNLYVKRSHRNAISKLLKSKDKFFSDVTNSEDDQIKYFQTLIGHLYSAGQVNPRYKQLGKKMVEERKLSGILGMNQFTG